MSGTSVIRLRSDGMQNTGRRIACPYQIIRQNRGHFVSEILFIVRSLLNVTA